MNEPPPGHATLDISLLPAYQADMPILEIELAPSCPSLPASHLHEGPWLSIGTATSLHFCAIHRLGSQSRGDASGHLPEYVLTHICSFLTSAVAARIRTRGIVHKVGRHHVACVAWHPTARSAALIGDVSGGIWLWKVDLKPRGKRRWLTDGQSFRKVAQIPLDVRQEALQQLLWLGPHDDQPLALARTCDGVFVVDPQTGKRLQSRHAGVSSSHLAPSYFHHAVTLQAPGGSTVLTIASSSGLHIVDPFHPSREMLFVPHHRAFWDSTLRLTPIDGHTGTVALSSTLDPAVTIYHFGWDSTEDLQPIRAWQCSPPYELAPPAQGAPNNFGGDLLIRPWTDVLSDVDQWQKWRKQNHWAYISRLCTGEITLRTIAHKSSLRAQTADSTWAIHTSPNPALSEVVDALKARAGETWHPRASRRGRINEEDPLTFASAYLGLLALAKSSSTGRSRQSRLLKSLQNGASPLDAHNGPFITALDVVAYASLHFGDAPVLTPFASSRGAISALYLPHTLQSGSQGPNRDGTLSALLAALKACRQQGWWDGGRCLGSGVEIGSRNVLEDVDDTRAVAEELDRIVDSLEHRYLGPNTRSSSSTSVAIRQALHQLILHCSLSNEVWSSRPIEIEPPKGFEADNQSEHLGSQASALSQPGPWNPASTSSASQTPRSRRRRQDSVAPTPSSGKRKRDDPLSQLSQPLASQGYITDDDGDDDADPDALGDVDLLAKQKVPEPGEVHFAYFRGNDRAPGVGSSSSSAAASITTPAARLLLSSWPLSSLDPRDPDNDPSHYTFTDPYALLDAARASNEDGYASSTSARSTDTGWSSAWSATSASGISDGEQPRSRSQSVWSSSAHGRVESVAASSQGFAPGHHFFATGSMSQPAAVRDIGRERAPPSIAPRGTWDRERNLAASQPHLGTPMGWSAPRQAPSVYPASQGPPDKFAAASQSHSQAFTGGASMNTASQPVLGSHASRKASSKQGKKAKKRLGGF